MSARARAILITDAVESPADNQRRRRRVYAALMVVHLVGLLAAAAVYTVSPWLALAIMLLTGALPWVAVVLANDARPRPAAHGRAVRDGLGRPGLPYGRG